MIAKEKNGLTKIHNVRFYNLSPRSINCLVLNKELGKLALSRSDNSIEIWDVKYAAFLEKTLPTKSSIEALAWFDSRLFSAGLTGELIEWDLVNLQPKQAQYVTGGSIWCLDVNKHKSYLAIGTEDGYLNIFDISDGNLLYKNLFDKQDGRILCCKFDEFGKHVVTGSLDVIRIWSTKSGHALRKMALARSEAKRETIVWSLVVLRDFTIISGDSRGQVTVWNGLLGAQTEAHLVLKADVLAVAVNEEENMLICAGVEPIIRVYSLTTITQKDGQKTNCWVKFIQRSIHDNNVKALVCSEDKIYSGGIDGYLGISSYLKIRNPTIAKYGPFLQGSIASVSSDHRIILLRYPNYLEIWKLGTPHGEPLSYDQQKLFSIKDEPEKLLQLRSINDDLIMCSVLSPNGKWLLYSTINSIRLFSFTLTDSVPVLSRIKYLPDQFDNCIRALFSKNSNFLYLVKLNNHVDIFKILESGEIDFTGNIDLSKSIKGMCHLLEVSNCERYLIAAGTCRTISVWQQDLKKKKWSFYLKLPKHYCPTTAIALHKNHPRLVATFSDGKIFEYDLEEMHFTCVYNDYFVDNSSIHCVNNILLDERNENVIVLHNDTYLYVLEKTEKSDECQKNNKKFKKPLKDTKTEEINTNNMELSCKVRKTFEHFVHLSWLSNDEMVAVGVNPVSLIEELPPTMKLKKFGAS